MESTEAGCASTLFSDTMETVRERRVDHALRAPFGDVGKLGAGDAQGVEGDGHGLAVEVAPRNDGLVLQEQKGVVRDSVQLDLHLVQHVVQRVAHRAVVLGHAAQGVGVLHPIPLAAVQDLGPLHQAAHVGGHPDLPPLAADLVDARVKGVLQGGQPLEGQGGDDVRQLGRADRVVEGQGPDRRHGAGAVRHAQALLAGQRAQRGDIRLLHRLRSAHLHAPIQRPSAPQEGQRHVGQRRQVAGRAKGALLGDDGRHPPVQHLDEHLHQDGPHSGDPSAQGVGPQEHHAAHHLGGVGVPRARAVAQDQVRGELVRHLLRHRHLLKVPEARGDAVGRALLPHDLLRQRPGPLHGAEGGPGQLHGGAKPCNGNEALKGEALSIHHNALHCRRVHDHRPNLTLLLKLTWGYAPHLGEPYD